MKSELRFDDAYLDVLRLSQGGYCCSQILVKLALQDLGCENPDLVRATAALCYGTGYADGACGVLTGAGCALSLCAGNDAAQELPHAGLPGMLGELVKWFTAKAENSYGGTRCADILRASPDKRACAVLLVQTRDKIQSILAASGLLDGGEML